jgi:lipopolysaccharide-binding protein
MLRNKIQSRGLDSTSLSFVPFTVHLLPSPAPTTMAHLHLLPILLLLFVTTSVASGGEQAHVAAVVAEKGLAFAKDVLIEQAVRSLTPLRLPGVEKTVRVPFLGGVRVAASNITLFHLNVGDNSTIYPGDSGLVVVASGITANLSMDWSYCFDSWIFPLEIADRGTASILVSSGFFPGYCRPES